MYVISNIYIYIVTLYKRKVVEPLKLEYSDARAPILTGTFGADFDFFYRLCVHSVSRSFGAHLTIAVSNHTHVLLITICRLNSSTTATAAATKIRTTNDREIIVCFYFKFWIFCVFIFP